MQDTRFDKIFDAIQQHMKITVVNLTEQDETLKLTIVHPTRQERIDLILERQSYTNDFQLLIHIVKELNKPEIYRELFPELTTNEITKGIIGMRN